MKDAHTRIDSLHVNYALFQESQLDIVRNQKMPTETRDSVRRKEGFQVSGHPSQIREYAKLKTNKEMGFKMGEKRT